MGVLLITAPGSGADTVQTRGGASALHSRHSSFRAEQVKIHLDFRAVREGFMEPYREGGTPSIRASDQERDAVVQRLQVAFAEGRLDDEEFDGRMRGALAARTHDDLD